MPTEEHHPQTPALEGMPDLEQEAREAEQRHRTLAFKLEEGTHAQLHFIAQLRGSNAASEARLAIDAHLAAAQQDPELIARADEARQAIERDAAARAAAIAGFMGKSAVEPAETGPTGTKPRSRGKTVTDQTN
jgi:hypothetical protein